MARAKSERILNLTLYLLSAGRYVGRDRIREGVEGYAGLSDEAFERAFERDKDELRSLGVPIQTGSNSSLFDDEVGYRIARSEFELPPISFTAAEAQILAIAAHVWEQAAMADSTVAAVAKLRAAGVEVDADRIAALAPTMTAHEPAFLPLWRATATRRRVRFAYKGPGRVRTVESWRILSRNGAWYVVGRDVDKGQPRMFRLSRISSDVTITAVTYTVPEDVDLDALTARFAPDAPVAEAVLAIRPGRAPAVRRQGTRATDIAAPAGYDPYRVPFADLEQFAGILRSDGADVLVLEPAPLREAVLAGLRRVAGAA
ncbi:helix-turn-helix transcriptional regulator [Propionicicella superfundia]|uniref:helix-turn-helix transcriptional regulator n=1 Tax=Propionicicella superfundia TaxID=348582 RepID=UPI00048FD5A7|nr:WYL domain-containing protein [Propionicicella superfundia]